MESDDNSKPKKLWIIPAILVGSFLVLTGWQSPSSNLMNLSENEPRVSQSALGNDVSAAGSHAFQKSAGNDIIVMQNQEGVGAHMGGTGNDLKTQKLSSSTSPHIILFTIDDMGWNDIGYYSTDLPEATPYMTSLASQGIKLTHYYSMPSCTPSRISMMTGKFPYRNGFQNYELQHVDEVGIPLSNKLMPVFMKELGYTTHMLGKWNVGHCSSKYLPQERGFDHFIGYLCPGHGYTDFNCGLNAGVRDMIQGSAVTDETTGEVTYSWSTGAEYLGTYDTELYRDKSVVALMKHAASGSSAPLFLWSAQHGIHSEFDSDPIPPASLLTKDNKEYLKVLEKRMDIADSDETKHFFKMRKITASVLMSLDNSLRSLVTALDETGMLDNTLLFVNSDNGGDTIYTKGHPGNNYPLRSEKFSYFEGGIRTPAFIYAPGIIPTSRVGTSYHGMMHHVDLIPTFYTIGGGDTATMLASQTDMDGLDHWSAILGESTGPRQELVLNLPRSKDWKFGESKTSEGVALRMGNYKLLLNHVTDGWFAPSPGFDFGDAAEMMASSCKYDFYSVVENVASTCDYTHFLFDLSTDPHERTNLFLQKDLEPVRQKMIARAEELCAAQTNDYGKIIPEAYMRTAGGNSADAFKEHDGFVVPWECDLIP